jgi:hypothetical protein
MLNLSITLNNHTSTGVHPPTTHCITWLLLTGGKADNSPPSSADVMNERNHTSATPYLISSLHFSLDGE